MAAGNRSTNLWRAGDVAAVRVMSSALGKTDSSCCGFAIRHFPATSRKPGGQFPVVRAVQLSAVPMVLHRNNASIKCEIYKKLLQVLIPE
jgi:hypothetical protein